MVLRKGQYIDVYICMNIQKEKKHSTQYGMIVIMPSPRNSLSLYKKLGTVQTRLHEQRKQRI